MVSPTEEVVARGERELEPCTDEYKRIASEVLRKHHTEVTKEERETTKKLAFGSIYGMTGLEAQELPPDTLRKLTTAPDAAGSYAEIERHVVMHGIKEGLKTVTNNFFKQAATAHEIMVETNRRILEQHKDCPNFVVVQDEYSCGPDCHVRNDLIADAAKAEELFDIDELEDFAAKFNAKNRST